MPSVAVLAAVQALNGAVGAGGGAITLIQYYPMQESAGIANLYNGANTAPVGNWIGPPHLRGAYGPAENDSPSYAVTFSPSGSSQYASLYAGPSALGAINGRGLFVCVAIKHNTRADRDTILSAADPAGHAGFRIALNQGLIGETSANSESALFGSDVYGGSAVCANGACTNQDLQYDDQWHLHMWFLRAPATIKHWIDGLPKQLIISSNGAMGELPTQGARLVAGAATFGMYTDGSPQYGFNGAMSDLVLAEGEPTQTQMRDICRAMFYTVRGVPGVVAHYRPGPGGAFADTAMTIPAVESGHIQALKDLSGHGNHATNPNAATSPTLERTINGGRWCASFDNFTSNYSEWAPLGMSRQQSLAVAISGGSRIVQTHMGCLASVRTLASSCFAKGQTILGFTAAGAPYNALEIKDDEPCVERDGGFILAADIPKVRCMPGLGVMGFTSGIHGDGGSGDAVFVNNRFQSPAASALNTGVYALQYIDQWNIADWPGQMFPGGGQHMWAGWLEETIITKCPYLPEEAAAYVARTFAEAGEPLNPKYHVCVVGDSIASGNRSDRSRTMLGGDLPVQARQLASFTNASIAGYRVQSTVGPSMTSRGLDSPKWWDPGARNIAAVELVVNDAIDGDDQATFGADMDVLIPQLRAGGANTILWNEETNNLAGPGPTPRNLAIESHLGSGAINGIVFLTPLDSSGFASDGLHPSPAGQAIWAGDWWTQGLSPYVKASKALSPTQGKLDNTQR